MIYDTSSDVALDTFIKNTIGRRKHIQIGMKQAASGEMSMLSKSESKSTSMYRYRTDAHIKCYGTNKVTACARRGVRSTRSPIKFGRIGPLDGLLLKDLNSGCRYRRCSAVKDKNDKLVWRVSTTVGLCTIISKITGLLREVVLAALFGIGPVMDAFTYAAVIPSYFQSVVGGINGPFHTAMLVSSSRQKSKDTKDLVEIISTWMMIPILVLAVVIFNYPGLFINLFAPGLHSAGSRGLLEESLAKIQLKGMAPCLLSGVLCGIGFGALNAAQNFVIPSLSPAISNTAMISCLILLRQMSQATLGLNQDILMSRNLSIAFVCGCLCQTVFQAAAMHKEKIGRFMYPRFNIKDYGVFLEMVKILVPATIASTMLQLAMYTDLFFASSWPGAAATITCASILVTAPLGLISSVITIPRVPAITKLAAQKKLQDFASYLNSMLFLCIDVALPLTIGICAFAPSIVKCVFERSAFTASSTSNVVPVLIVNSLGIVFFLLRDVLIRAFYALDRKGIPPLVSGIALVLNFILDMVLCKAFSMSAVGLVLATIIVSAISVIILFTILLKDLPEYRHATKLVWKQFAIQTALATASTLYYAKHANWIMQVLGKILHSFPFVDSNMLVLTWIINCMVTAACFISTWILYVIVSKGSQKIIAQQKFN